MKEDPALAGNALGLPRLPSAGFNTTAAVVMNNSSENIPPKAR